MAASESREAGIERLRPFQQRARGFSGWSFDLDVRRPPLPWDYDRHVRGFARGMTAVLDIGTGGGERLAKLRDDLPRMLVATEEWPTNAPIARERLAPLGVEVVHASDEVSPFEVNSFDLVINRHSAFDPAEIARILRPGGALLTQQVGRADWQELAAHFPRLHDCGDLLGRYSSELRELGFNVTLHEFQQPVAYPSLGEFVYMLSVTTWLLAGFDVERDVDALLALERDCLTDDGLMVTEDRYLLTARMPAY